MPASYLSPPSDKRSKAIRDQRVSFNVGGGSSKYPDDLFSGSSSSSFVVPGHIKHKHHRHHLSHANTSQGAQKSSRRARVDDVDDVDDSEDDSNKDDEAKPSKDKGKGKDQPADQGTAPVAYPIPQPPGSTAAYNTLINPALGPNTIYTHQYQAPPQGYNIQALPTFVQSGTPFPMATMDPYSGATGINFLPAVPDATNGPMMHTYVPRNDPPGISGFYMQHPGGFPQGQAYPGASIATSTAPVLPIMHQPMYVQQPPMAYGGGGGGGGCGQPPIMMMPGNYPGGYPGMVHPEPALGVGQTPAEVMQEQLEFAYANNMNEPQDFKPADDDVSRFYWVREIDGNWTQRSRATIDHIGCRWYITDTGVFYAVRLPD